MSTSGSTRHPRPHSPSEASRISTSSNIDSPDSEENDLIEWEKRSKAWMAAYEVKVSKCIELNRFPDGLLDLMASPLPRVPHLHNPLKTAPEVLSASQTQLKKNAETNTASAGSSAAPSTSRRRRVDQGPPDEPLSRIPSPDLPPSLICNQSDRPTSVIPLTRSIAAQEPSENEEENHYVDHDTIIEDFTDVDIPATTNSPLTHEHASILPQDLLKPFRREKQSLDVSIKFRTDASTSKRDSSSNATSFGTSKKTKELRTIADYEKLSSREKASRFPSVELFKNFLNGAFAPASSVGQPKSKRKRAIFSDTDICYLLDITIRQKLNATDRMRMQKLSEAGAKLHSKPKVGQTTHIIIGGVVESWKICRKAIGEVLSDNKELREINEMIRGPDDGEAGVNVIWLLNARWIENSLSSMTRMPEKAYRIKPRDSNHAKKPITDSKLPTIIPSGSRSGIRPSTGTRKPTIRNSSGSSHRECSSESDEIEISITSALPPIVRSGPLPAATTSVTGLDREIQRARLGEGREVEGSEDDRSDSLSDDDESSREGHDLARHGPNFNTTWDTRKLYQTKYARDRPGGGVIKKDGPNADICEKVNFEESERYFENCLEAGIGVRTAEKIVESAHTGTSRRFEFTTEQDTVRTLLVGIYAAQEIGLRYYDDLQEGIPRQEVVQLFDFIRAAELAADVHKLVLALKINSNLLVFPMGSYRRGGET
ncbi:hypothetical protein CROQUDRAFT_85354 [Cronartium quercuum f. sp. fusiforme G11]|uniref:BRCT domain-containing protein n=1 Tax=Cronartium quercuum f. sp. fusiforme G11 TaxID=708437 RepID=A0A9P6TI14_9BASI|nr:hypothetical protein CROQUDRAFT_85354 [Cronartium quercuum f. sp. fusiforme G11]